MVINTKFNEGELVIIGTLQDVNTADNVINLSVLLSKETCKSVTIFSKKISILDIFYSYEGKFPARIFLQENEENARGVFLNLPKQGIILVDNLSDYAERFQIHSGSLAKKSASEINTKIIESLSYHAKKTNTTVIVITNTSAVRDKAGKNTPDLRYVNGYCYFMNYCNRAFLWKGNSENSSLEFVLCHEDKSQNTDTNNWLLRRDGEVFPMEYDVIIDGEPSSEVQLSNIVWLFEHTLKEETKRHITAFIRKLCITNGYPWEMEYIEENLGSKLKNIAEYECDSAGYLGVYDYFDKVLFCFDEEFLHVCLGGEYHTVSGNRDMYFRISSEDFDWTKVIDNFKTAIDNRFDNEHITVDKYAKERNPKAGTKDEGEGLWYFYG